MAIASDHEDDHMVFQTVERRAAVEDLAREAAGHHSGNGHQDEREARQAPAQKPEAARMVGVRGRQLQIQARHLEKEPGPEHEDPEPAQEQKEQDRQAHQDVPPAGERDRAAERVPTSKSLCRGSTKTREDKETARARIAMTTSAPTDPRRRITACCASRNSGLFLRRHQPRIKEMPHLDVETRLDNELRQAPAEARQTRTGCR